MLVGGAEKVKVGHSRVQEEGKWGASSVDCKVPK